MLPLLLPNQQPPRTTAQVAPRVPFHSFKREDAQPLRPGEAARVSFGLLPTSYRFREGALRDESSPFCIPLCLAFRAYGLLCDCAE